MPRRTGRAAVVELTDDDRGTGSIITRHPREFVGIVMATAAVLAVFVNALYLQKGPHPAPIFAVRPLLANPALASLVTPQVAPPVRAANPAVENGPLNLNIVQLTASIQREMSRRGFYDGAADGIWGAKTDAAARDFVQSAGLRINPEPGEALLRAILAAPMRVNMPPSMASPRSDPIAELIEPSKRVLAIQRALADFGYGQIKPTGAYDLDTRAAIEKFERDRRLPVTGQISDRFVRELAAMTGRPLE